MLQKLHELAAAHGLSANHPPAVMAETAAWQAQPGIDDPTLMDLTHMPFCTIDEVHSKDLDQALYVEMGGPAPVLWYAIADAAHFVPVGSALFKEALKRGATYYLPGLVLPMLPKALSEDLCSLNPGVDRRALVWRLPLNPDGSCAAPSLHRARVNSRAKLDYDGVDQMLLSGEWPKLPPGVQESLEGLRVMGSMRMRHADERDVVRYRRRNLSFSLSPGLGIAVWTDLRNQVERYNEQASLLCNTVGARMLRQNPERAAIYRVHPEPPAKRIQRLHTCIDSLCALRGLEQPWAWQGQDLADYLEALPTGRLARAIHRQAMVSNQASTFAPEPAPHHGVGADVYGRFSAPMREIVGVYSHSELLKLGTPDPQLRAQVIDASNAARSLQKRLDKQINLMAIDALFERDLDLGSPQRAGTVVGITRSRVHVQLDDPAIDLKAYAQDLPWPIALADGDAALLDPQGGVRLALGDAVMLRAIGREKRRWKLSIE